MVVASHCAAVLGTSVNFGASPFGHLFQFGRSGVDFFFVLSGFLISLLHWKDIGRPKQLKRYAVRRITRIYPTYWLILLPIIPIDIFTHTLFDNYENGLDVLKSLFLLPQYTTILDVTWSLRNELLFYFLFGLMIYSRRIGSIVIGLWIIGLTVRSLAAIPFENTWLNLLTYPMNFEFLTGVTAGWAFGHLRIAHPAKILAAGMVAFMALWIAEDRQLFAQLSWSLFLFRSIAYGIAAASVIIGLSALELHERLKMPQGLITLGGASYLLYLVHVPALLVFGASERHLHLLYYLPAWLLAALFVAMTITGAVWMHLIIEKPMLRAIRTWSTKLFLSPTAHDQ